jgi:hypothetical protein
MPFRLSLVPAILLAVRIAAATSLTGAWTFEWTPDFGGEHPTTHECQVTQTGNALTIQCDEQTMKGHVHGNTVTFEHTTGLKDEITATYTVTLNKDATTMTGSWHLSGGPHRDGKFQAHKH